MRQYRFIILLLISLSLHPLTKATSQRAIGPIADIDQIAVDTMRGDSLGIPSDRGQPIFGNDFARVERLEAKIKAVASNQFKAGGIEVIEKSKDVVIFKLFGGTFTGSGNDPRVFFMLQVDVCSAQEQTCSQEWTFLGVSEESMVEQAVLEAVSEAAKGFVDQRSAYRAAIQKQKSSRP